MQIKNFFKNKLWILLIPLVILTLTVFLKKATGPYWLGPNSDPAYLYLINSLYILKGISPSFVDHPGTTLELLGAAVIKILNGTADQSLMIDHVLLNPEYYLNALFNLMLFLNISTLILIGWYAYKKSKDLLFALLTQFGAFMFLVLKSYASGEPILTVASNVFAESLFPFIDNLFIFCLLWIFFKKEKSYWAAFFFGIVSAAGVITKMSFAPLAIIPFILIKGFRARLLFLFSFVLWCFIFTIPIISEYKEMFNYIYLFQANKGFHGTGGVGMMSLQELWNRATRFIPQHKVLFGSFCASLFIIISSFVKKEKGNGKEKEARSRSPRFFLSVIYLGMFLQILFVLKHPAPHYAAPTVGLVGILLGFSYWVLLERYPFSRKIFGGLLLALLVGFSLYTVKYQQSLKERNDATYAFSQKVVDKYKGCVICNHYRSSSVAYALYFGDDCKGRHRAFFDRLKELYPRALVWNRWDYTFHNFPDQVSDQSLLNASPCLLLYGSRMNFSNSYINAELIDSSVNESVYKVTSSNRAQTMKTFFMAKTFEIKKDYKTALVLAMKAKELGFPPLRIDRYIEELKGKINAK